MDLAKRLAELRARKLVFNPIWDAVQELREEAWQVFESLLIILRDPEADLATAHLLRLRKSNLIAADAYEVEAELADMLRLRLALLQTGGEDWDSVTILNTAWNLFCGSYSEYLAFLACAEDPTLPVPAGLENCSLITGSSDGRLTFRPGVDTVISWLKTFQKRS